MAIPLTINGVTFQYPQQFDRNWGPTLTNWSSAVTTGMLQKAGGSFTLTAEVDFGSTYGLVAPYFKSSAAGIASTGVLRLANASSGVVWRNQLGSGDLALTVNASNQLTFNGVSIGATTSLTNGHILVGDVSNQPADVAMSGDIAITNAGVTSIGSGVIVDADINASAAIAVSKLATLTASRIVTSDGSGFLTTTASPTLTELSYVGGATSSLQAQINTITGTTIPGYLPLAGGTMSGVLNMGSNKIQSVTQGSNTGEAISYPVGTSQISSSAITTSLIAANAVSQVVSNGASSGLFGSVSLTSQAITTTGGPVLILANANLGGTPSGSPLQLFFRTSVKRGSTAITGADAQCISWFPTSSGTPYFMLPIIAVDTPAAGTYTYNLEYTQGAGTAPVINSYSLVLVELKR